MPDDATSHLIDALIAHLRGADEPWESLALVVRLGGRRVQGTHGYAYTGNGGVLAVASRPSGVSPAVLAYLDTHFSADEPVPVQLLVQFDRTSGRYEITFEDTDRTRWKVTPANLDAVTEELRPHLAATDPDKKDP